MMVYMDSIQKLPKPTVVCLGFFDGVHIGHQQLINRAVSIAREKDFIVCAHTFSQMPSRILQPQKNTLELTSLAEKVALMEGFGVQIVAVSTFNKDMMNMKAEAFFYDILLAKLHAEHLVVGFHYRFGFHGEGDVETLHRLCNQSGLSLDVIEPVGLANGQLVSSTEIRRLLQEGEREKAEAMLGRSIILGP